MTPFITDNALLLAVLACLLVGPCLAILLLTWRRRARPGASVVGELARPPGFTLLASIDSAARRLTRDGLVLSAIPLTGFALCITHATLLGWAEMLRLGWFYVFAASGLCILMLRRLMESAERLDRLRIGLDAELSVGQELDQLMRSGAAVFHDFPAEGFRIDHIVVSTQGVYAVETQGFEIQTPPRGSAPATVVFDGHTLRFPTGSTEAPLLQAERQAKWLSRWITGTLGQMVLVTPVLALPGWAVRFTGRSTVRVYSGRSLHTLLGVRSRQPMSEQDVQRIVHAVAQHCRASASPAPEPSALPARRRRRVAHS